MTASSLFTITLVLIRLHQARAGNLLLNAGGSALPCVGFRADNGRWASKPSTTFSNGQSASGWNGVYPTHRWARSGDLVYNIPVPNGNYKVYLMFAETWRQARLGTRQFHVLINGKRVIQAGGTKPLDVFSRVGYAKPLFINAWVHKSVSNQISVRLARVAGKNNPMISGIAVIGKNADKLATLEGFASCKTALHSIPPSPTPSTSQLLKPTAVPAPSTTPSSSLSPSTSPKVIKGPRNCTVLLTIRESVYATANKIVPPTTLVYNALLNKKSIGLYTSKFTGMRQSNGYWQVHTHQIKFTSLFNPFKDQELTMQPVSPKSYDHWLYSIGGIIDATNVWYLKSRYCAAYCGSASHAYLTSSIRITCGNIRLYSTSKFCTRYFDAVETTIPNICPFSK